MEEKNIFILLIILIVISNLYLIIKINYLEKEKNTEKFAVTNDVINAINENYKGDVESMRNLAALATKLQAGTLTIPGKLIGTGGIYTKGGAAGGNGLQTQFPWTDGINYIRGNTTHDGILNVRDNVTVGNKLILPNNTQFSGDADFLRLTDTAGNYKPLAVKDLWVAKGNIYGGNIRVKGNISVKTVEGFGVLKKKKKGDDDPPHATDAPAVEAFMIGGGGQKLGGVISKINNIELIAVAPPTDTPIPTSGVITGGSIETGDMTIVGKIIYI